MSRQASPVPVHTIIANIKEKGERAHLFSHLETVAQCVEHLPYAYRAPLKTKFFASADAAEKRSRVFKTYHTLRHHKNTGTYPPQLEAVHEPAFQYTKEYLEAESSAGDAYASLMHAAWIDFRATMLKHALNRKKAELAFLEKKIRPAAYHDDILACVQKVRNSQRLMAGLEAIAEEGDVIMGENGGTTPPISKSSSGATGEASDGTKRDWMDTDFTFVKIDALALAGRVVDIINTRDMLAVNKALEKLALQSTAMDVEPDERVLRQQSDKALDERVARAVQAALAKKSEYSPSSSEDNDERFDKCYRGKGQKRTRGQKRAEG